MCYNSGKIVVEDNPDSIFYSVRAALLKANKRILLMIDELDKFYEVDPGKDYAETLERSLAQLAIVGDDDSGSFAAVLCGSSSRVPVLISGNGKSDPTFAKEFPLVQLSINLNGTKFRTRRVYSTTPVDLSTVASILGDTAKLAAVRFITFLTGGVAREIQRLADFTDGGPQDSTFIEQFHVESDPRAAQTLSLPSGELWNSILDELQVKNASLLNELKDEDGTLSVEKLSSVEWEGKLQPLSYTEVQKLWKTNKNANVPNSLDHWLYHLYDRDYICIGRIEGGHPTDIYPYSLYMLTRHKMDSKILSKTKEHFLPVLHSPLTVALFSKLISGL